MTDIVSPYRVPVFAELAKLVDLHVLVLGNEDRHREWPAHRRSDAFMVTLLPTLPFTQAFSFGGRPVHLNSGIRRVLRSLNPDAVVIGGWNQPAFWAAMVAPDWPFVLWVESTLRDSRSGHGLLEGLKRQAIRRADAFLVPGMASAAYLASFGVTQPILTAANAVDVNFFAASPTAQERKVAQIPGVSSVFAFVGRPEAAKGIDLALAVVADNLEAGLVVLGESPERVHWQHRARELGVHARVRFLGHRDATSVRAVLHQACALLVPSRTDPWGLVINEAQAAGCPVICSPVPGAVDDLAAGDAALVVPLLADAWVAAARLILEEPSLGLRLTERGRAMAARHTPAECASGLAAAVTVAAKRAG